VEDLHAHEENAFEAMLEWKRARAKEMGFNDPCIICHNRTLLGLVRLLPENEEELLAVWGMGAKRVASHGNLMLQELQPFRAALLSSRGGGRQDPAVAGDAAN
jgi:superfamily II DNA helicase RecQ